MSSTSPPGTPSVAVVVTHYRALPVLQANLVALAAVLDPATSEVVVCDSAAEPPAQAVVAAAHPGARYVPFVENVGFARLVNAGIAASTAPLVLVLNADVRLEADTLPALVRALDEHPSLGLVAPVLLNDDGSRQASAFAFHRASTVLHRRTATGRTPWGRRELRRFEAPAAEVAAACADLVEADWVLGAAMLVRRRAIEDAGPMDPSYFLYFEDVDWCLRLWRSGWRVAVDTRARAHHSHGRGSRGRGPVALLRNPLARAHLRSAVRFFRQHGLTPSRPRSLEPAPRTAADAP